ncbi:beige/BEACH domain-containing protein [Ditylenchus destructor]|nr:beige/BEACH domain-containing protein [Ditylenchus destructor]
MENVFGPRKYVSDLIFSLEGDAFLFGEGTVPHTNEWQYISEVFDLIARYTIQSCDHRTSEKAHRFLENILQSVDLSECLSDILRQCSKTVFQRFASDDPFTSKELVGLSIDRPFAQRSFCDDMTTIVTETVGPMTKTKSTPRKWNRYDVHNFHCLYFGPSKLNDDDKTEIETSSIFTPSYKLDLAVATMKTLGVLAMNLRNCDMLASIFRFTNSVWDPNTLELNVNKEEVNNRLGNLIAILDYSANLGKMVRIRESGLNTSMHTECGKDLEVALAHRLEVVKKLLSIHTTLERLITACDARFLPNIMNELTGCLDRHVFGCVKMLMTLCNAKVTTLDFYINQFLECMDNYAKICETSTLIQLLENTFSTAEAKFSYCKPTNALESSHCLNRTVFSIYFKITNLLRTDRSSWAALIHLSTRFLSSICNCVHTNELLDCLLFLVDQTLLKDLTVVLQYHFNDYSRNRLSCDITNISTSSSSTNYGDSISQWFKQPMSYKTYEQLLEVFSIIWPYLSSADYDHFALQLLSVLQSFKSCGGRAVIENLLIKSVNTFAVCLKPKQPLFLKALIAEITLDLDDRIHNIETQEDTFRLVGSILKVADQEQFNDLMELELVEKYQRLLKMAETDVWVLFSETAENFRSALQLFLDMFKGIIKDTTMRDKFRKEESKVVADCSRLTVICIDFLHGTNEPSRKVRLVAEMISTLIVIQLAADSTKRDELADTFNKLRENSTVMGNLLVLKRILCEFVIAEEKVEICNTRETSMSAADEMTNACSKGNRLSYIRLGAAGIDEIYKISVIIEQIRYQTSTAEKISKGMEYLLSTIFGLIRPIDMKNATMKQRKVILDLFEIVNHLNTKGAQLRTVKKLLDLIGKFVMANPKASFLSKFFSLCHKNSEMTEHVVEMLRTILDISNFEPGETLLFPQNQLPSNENAAEESYVYLNSNGAASLALEPGVKISLSCGLSVSSWIKLISNKSSSWLHIISIGDECLKMTAEVKPSSAIFRVRLQSKIHSLEWCIFQETFASVLSVNGALVNFTLGLQYANNEIKSTIVVGNHVKCFGKAMDMKISADEVPFQVTIGSSVKPQKPLSSTSISRNNITQCETFYEIATIFAFKGLLQPKFGILLRSIGSACFSLTDCRISQIYCSFLNCLTRPTICSDSCELCHVCSEPQKFLAKLQRMVLFTLRPSSAHCFALNILQKGVDSSSLSEMSDSALCLTMSKNLDVHWHTTIVQNHMDTLDKSLRTLGGIKIFIFLYALSVDKNYSAKTQLGVLHLLFLCLKRDPSYHHEFSNLDGNSVIIRMLSSRSAHMNLDICHVFLRFIFSKLETDSSGELFVGPRTAILEPNLLKALLSSADLWRGPRFQYWTRIIRMVSDSLSSQVLPPKFKNFNHKQVTRVQLLHQLLHTLLDMFQNKESYQFVIHTQMAQRESKRPPLTLPVFDLAETMRNLVSEMIGMPYKCMEVTVLWNFILLSHPAHDTYLDYSIKSHNAWIQPESLDPGDEPEPQEKHTELSDYFQDILKKHGREKIVNLWIRTNNSAIAVRKELNKEDEVATYPLERQHSHSVSPKLYRRSSVEYPLQMPLSSSKNGDVVESRQRFPSDIPENEHWLVQTRAKFLQLMSNVVLNCEDPLMTVLELDVLYWQTILVLLSNQKYSKIRTLTFALLKNFFLRCSQTHRMSFASKQGFFLLSNELKKAPVNNQIADALFSLTCGEHVILRDGLDAGHLEKLIYDPFKVSSFYALYTLLEESMFMAENAPRRAMLECGLVDTLVNVLRKLCLSSIGPPMDSPVFSLLDCWLSFAESIILFLVPYRDAYNYGACEDFLWLCITLVWQYQNSDVSVVVETLNDMTSSEYETQHIDKNKHKDLEDTEHDRTILAMRRATSRLIYGWIDCIQSKLSDQMRVSYFSMTNDAADNYGEDFEILPPDAQWSPNRSYTTTGAEFSTQTERHVQAKEMASLDELGRRLLFGLSMAKNYFLYIPPFEKCSDEEESLFRFYIETILSTWKRRPHEKHSDEWQVVLAFCREKARVLLAELIAFVLFRVQTKGVFVDEDDTANRRSLHPRVDSRRSCFPWTLKRRLIIVRYLSNEILQNRKYIVNLLEVNLDYQYAMKIALHELSLLPSIVEQFDIREFEAELERLIRFLRSIQIESPLANPTQDEISSLVDDEFLLVHSYFQNKCQFCNQLVARSGIIVERENTVIKFTSDKAMTLTCEIAEYQNTPRRAFIQWRKELTNELAKAGNTLGHLVREFCHPQAIFFDSNCWPLGHALDTTENPCRERRRLQPAHYQFPLKFLRKEWREMVAKSYGGSLPLENLLQDFKDQKTLDHVEAINQVRLSISATLLRTAFECTGEIVVSDQKLYFLGEHAKSTQKGFIYAPVTYSWSFEQVREIHSRFYLLKDTALELFTTTGDAFLVVFVATEQRNVLLNQLNTMSLGHLIVDHKAQLQTAIQMWRRSSITNFEYLMVLNKLAGRSFNDLMQYPVFPFILSDYSSPLIDLESPFSYRDLTKPMAIQDPKMEATYIHNYNYSLEEFKKQKDSGFSSPVRFGAYHYGSHYSNTGIVAHYLVRLSPYTNVALEYQDNNFDIPDRLFNSIETTWRLSSSESTTDFKELIPEFFFFPEMFENLEKLDLGTRQAGQIVDDVILPAWCPFNNARLFCFIHRQALESPMVTANLHYWIDLIFGYKQSGEPALKAINLFHPATYRGRDLENESGSDELSISAVRTMVRTYGQMPLQLFPSPHLPHLNSNGNSTTGNRYSDGLRRSASVEKRQLFRSVQGLRWGEFVGSPETDDKYCSSPSYVFGLGKNERISHLSSIYKDGFERCFGVGTSTELIANYKSDRKDALRRNFELAVSSILSWRFSDNVLRIKLVECQQSAVNSGWINLIDMQSLELAKVVFSPSSDLLYMGFKCGLIRVYSLSFGMGKWVISPKSELFGHEYAITSLEASDEFHVLLSTSVDAKICLWDSNRLEFVSTFSLPQPTNNNTEETVTLSCISKINCDICVVLQSGFCSRVVLYTVNGKIVGVHEEKLTVTSLAMTNMQEGTAINCLAIGLQSGVIRLLEMWTMSVIRDIHIPQYHDPVISIRFTNEGKRLYALFSGLQVLCWQVPAMARSRSPSFKVLNPHF